MKVFQNLLFFISLRVADLSGAESVVRGTKENREKKMAARTPEG